MSTAFNFTKQESTIAGSQDPLVNNYKSSRPEMLCKKVVLRNFEKFTGKHLCQSLFINKVAGRGLQLY